MATTEEKMEAVQTYLFERVSLRELADKYKVHHSSIEKWVNNFQVFGEEGLRRPVRSTRYEQKDKEDAVRCYIEERQTLYSICRQYKIRSISTFQNWIAN